MKAISTESFSKKLLKEKARCFSLFGSKKYIYVLMKNSVYMLSFNYFTVLTYLIPGDDPTRFNDSPTYKEIPKEELIIKLIVEKLK